MQTTNNHCPNCYSILTKCKRKLRHFFDPKSHYKCFICGYCCSINDVEDTNPHTHKEQINESKFNNSENIEEYLYNLKE